MTKYIGIYYELYGMNENYYTYIEFKNEVDFFEVQQYIMQIKKNLPCWNTDDILEEIDKKYKIKNSHTLAGDEFIGI